MSRLLPSVSALLLLLAACQAPAPVLPPYAPRPVIELGRWQVQQALPGAEPGRDQQLGWLLLLEIQDPAGPVRYYRVENLRGQWVGHATLDGRWSRRVPFRDDEQDLGLQAMPAGLQALFLAREPVQVVGRPDVGAVEAVARRPKQP